MTDIQKAALQSIQLDGLDPELLAHSQIHQVQVDALVLLKIIQHVTQISPLPATGQLLGVDQVETLQVTHSFSFLSPTLEQEFTEEQAQEYQRSMLLNLRKANCDANAVGWYQSTYIGSFWNQQLIETQYHYQLAFPQSVVLIYDPTRTIKGSIGFTALRLTDAFMKLYENQKFNAESLNSIEFDSFSIFETIPITIRRSYLLSTVVSDFDEEGMDALNLQEMLSNPNPTFKFSDLDATSPMDRYELGLEKYLERHVEYLGDCAEEFSQEQWKWQNWHRTLVKEHQRLSQQASKRKQENAVRSQQGLEPAFTEDDLAMSSPALTKLIASEPSRLESLLIMNQMDTYTNQVNRFVGPTLLESAKSSSGTK
jgi:translation initiation factor 3 subunit H